MSSQYISLLPSTYCQQGTTNRFVCPFVHSNFVYPPYNREIMCLVTSICRSICQHSHGWTIHSQQEMYQNCVCQMCLSVIDVFSQHPISYQSGIFWSAIAQENYWSSTQKEVVLKIVLL